MCGRDEETSKNKTYLVEILNKHRIDTIIPSKIYVVIFSCVVYGENKPLGNTHKMPTK